jgi:hypothetical protein
MTLKYNNNHRGYNLTLWLCLTCLLYLANPGSSYAQVTSPSQTELVKIALKDKYSLTLRFNDYPGYAFNLWLPELAIFDSDLDRSQAADPIEGVWLSRRYGHLQVKGQLSTEKKGMDFKCTLNPLSASVVMLELEILNTGPQDWTDYAQLAVCLAPAASNNVFSDTTGERSYLNPKNARIQSIADAGVVGDYNHYVVGDRNDYSDSIQRARLSDGFVARERTDEKISISFMWEESARVDVNPGGLDCIHSHPAIGPLKAGDSKSLKGYIMIGEGTAEDHYTSMQDLIESNRNR